MWNTPKTLDSCWSLSRTLIRGRNDSLKDICDFSLLPKLDICCLKKFVLDRRENLYKFVDYRNSEIAFPISILGLTHSVALILTSDMRKIINMIQTLSKQAGIVLFILMVASPSVITQKANFYYL